MQFWDIDHWAIFWSAIQGIGTTAAVVVALTLSYRDRRANEEHRREVENRSERAQASQIFAWLDPELPKEEVYGGSAEPAFVQPAHLYATNGGIVPIPQAFVRIPHREWETRPNTLTDGYSAIGALIPGNDSKIGLRYNRDVGLLRTPVEMTFVDSDDQWWHRNIEGTLEKLDEPPPIGNIISVRSET